MCFLRHLDETSAIETLKASSEYTDYIYGVGLDSSEKGNPPEKFSNVFNAAKDMGYKLVAHAGEEGQQAIYGVHWIFLILKELTME